MERLPGIERPNPGEWSHGQAERVVSCTSCGRPCAIMHDLELSACCQDRIYLREPEK